MTQLEKLFLILLLKFRILPPKRYEQRIVAQIILDLSQDDSSEFSDEISIQVLMETSTLVEHDLFSQIRIIFLILRTRGLARTLLRKLFLSSTMNPIEFHLVPRYMLIKWLWINRIKVNNEVLSKVTLAYVKQGEIKDHPTINRTDYFQFIHKKEENLRQSIIEIRTDTKQKFRIAYKTTPLIFSFIHRFIQSNSFYFLDLIYSYNLTGVGKIFLEKNYPFLSQSLRDWSPKFIRISAHAHENLDSRVQAAKRSKFDCMKSVEIWHQRFLIEDDTYHVIDSTTDPRLRFVAGQWHFIRPLRNDSKRFLLRVPRRKLRVIEKGIFLCGRCDENWYHFLLDTLPRLEAFKNLPMNIPLLIRSDLPKTAKNLLLKITTRPLIEIPPDSRVSVETLYYVAARSSVFDSKPIAGDFRVEFPVYTLTVLRKRIFQAYQKEFELPTNDTFYVTRSSTTRNILNWNSLKDVMNKYQISEESLDAKFLDCQVQRFYCSDTVITPGGAVLANMLFMRPGKRVLVLQARRNRSLRLWEKLSKTLGIDYWEITGVASYHGFNLLRRLHTNFRISPLKLRRTLSKLNISRR